MKKWGVPYARLYLGPMPTRPAGMWCYDFLSDKADPDKALALNIPDGLKCFNPNVFLADKLAKLTLRMGREVWSCL